MIPCGAASTRSSKCKQIPNVGGCVCVSSRARERTQSMHTYARHNITCVCVCQSCANSREHQMNYVLACEHVLLRCFLVGWTDL